MKARGGDRVDSFYRLHTPQIRMSYNSTCRLCSSLLRSIQGPRQPKRLSSRAYTTASGSSSTSTSAPLRKKSGSTKWIAPEGWETIIGLEIHAQLRAGQKLFTRELLLELCTMRRVADESLCVLLRFKDLVQCCSEHECVAV